MNGSLLAVRHACGSGVTTYRNNINNGEKQRGIAHTLGVAGAARLQRGERFTERLHDKQRHCIGVAQNETGEDGAFDGLLFILGNQASDGEGNDGSDAPNQKGERDGHPNLLQCGRVATALAHGLEGSVRGLQNGAEHERRDEEQIHGARQRRRDGLREDADVHHGGAGGAEREQLDAAANAGAQNLRRG
ncbi:hypothetical protein FGB62_25g618 [Gracilaria domingensis]|nr:hypothetical protein FGB62_25g618 [Gracilaria domingensis]